MGSVKQWAQYQLACRKVYFHEMHHDVRTPMILDAISNGSLHYANPLRTSYHRCEIDQSRVPGAWLLNRPISNIYEGIDYPPCPYHSCCMLSVISVKCETCMRNEENEEPEECEYFVLEQRHQRFDYLGQPGAYIFRNGDFIPVHWHRRLFEINWFDFPIERGLISPKWEEHLFSEGEKLFRIANDAATQYVVMHHLENLRHVKDVLETANNNFDGASCMLRRQREIVRSIRDDSQLSNRRKRDESPVTRKRRVSKMNE